MIEEIIAVNKNIVKFIDFGENGLEKTFDSISDVKVSVFNYAVSSKEDGFVVFNTLYNSLFRFSKSEYLQMISEKSDDAKFKKLMLKNGFWINKEVDERKVYIEYANYLTQNLQRAMNLTLTTTLKCNARCKYCYEKGVLQKDFSDENFEKLISFIKSKMSEERFNNELNFNIFGGEPLMNEKIIEKFCNRLLNEKINFASYMITNGSLITEEKIENFKKWNIKDIQITLDGTSKVYSKLKNYINSNDYIFDKIIENIKLLSKNGIFVHIRMNISKENLNDIIELTSFLDKEFTNNDKVTFYPAFLTGIGEEFSEEEKVEICYSLLRKLTDLNNIPSTEKLFSTPRIHACMKSDPNSFVIDVNGNIFDCEHNVGVESKKIGTLGEKFVEINNRKKELPEKCKSCVFLPKCFGGCKSTQDEGEDFCFIEKYMIEAYMKLF